MYKPSDYIRNGLLYVNNLARPSHKRLSQLMIYSTTICQSRCKHCSIWKKEAESLSLDDIKAIMASKCVTPSTTVGLEGGEFILHPQAEQIMQWFHDNHPNYTLLSNCLTPGKVIDAVRKYRPVHLYVSLDGDAKTYEHMRGRDGYSKVIEVIEELRDEIPISLMFCLSPWNSFEDLEHVIEVAHKYHIDVRVGIYGTMAFFDTTDDLLQAPDFVQHIPQAIHSTSENYDFVALYDQWKKGALKLPCHSIYSSLVIHSNGDVPLCQNLDVVLGNIHENTLDEIFNGAKAQEIQREHARGCNGCWINFHRKYDIILARNFEKIAPKALVEKFYGPYQWCEDPSKTYKQHLKDIRK